LLTDTWAIAILWRKDAAAIGQINGHIPSGGCITGDACAREILEKRRSELDAGVQLLLKQETLTAEQFAPLCASIRDSEEQAAA